MVIGITVSLIVATLLLFILILSLYARHYASRDIRILADVARKYGAKISVDSFNSSATMDFQHRGTNMKFYQRKRLGGRATRLCLSCDVNYSSDISMHIAKGISGETSLAELRHFMFVPKIEVGSERFNKVFVVHGNNQSFLNALLATEFEKQLLSFSANDPILYLQPKKDVDIKIKSKTVPTHSLEFSVNQSHSRKEDLESLIDNGLALVRRFLGANIAQP